MYFETKYYWIILNKCNTTIIEFSAKNKITPFSLNAKKLLYLLYDHVFVTKLQLKVLIKTHLIF